MAQIFTASADTRLRTILLIAFAALTFAIIGGYAAESGGFSVGWVRDQPVPFSHQHHVAGLGLDCRYCHTSVEISEHAGLPPTHICMSCHSQIWTGADVLAPVRESLALGKPLVWQRVSRLPDYVYFNHSVHVTKGVPCLTCHGRVDQMPLTKAAHPFHMAWCLDCHRHPEKSLRPPQQVTRMEWSGWTASATDRTSLAKNLADLAKTAPGELTQCNTCHR